jgi:hypothetical protein
MEQSKIEKSGGFFGLFECVSDSRCEGVKMDGFCSTYVHVT